MAENIENNGYSQRDNAEHVNTICNDKINNLPKDFKGKFVVEERCRQISTKKTKVNHNKRVVEMLHRIVICIITALFAMCA